MIIIKYLIVILIRSGLLHQNINYTERLRSKMRLRNLKITSSAFALALGFSSLTTVAQEMPTNAELWETIQQQQAAIDATIKFLGINS